MRNGTLARRGAALGTARTGGLRQALRIASAAAIAFYGLAALLVLRRAGFGIAGSHLPSHASARGYWLSC